LLELPAQLRDGPTQELQFGALFVAQLDAPIPRLIGLIGFRCRGCEEAKRVENRY
jgi:hypothetical protein